MKQRKTFFRQEINLCEKLGKNVYDGKSKVSHPACNVVATSHLDLI